MGLRNSLQDILDIQKLTGEFATSADTLRKQAAQQELQQQLPGMLRTGQYGDIASLAGAGGNQLLQNAIVEQGYKSTIVKPGETPLDLAGLQAFAPKVDPSALAVVAGIKNRDDQMKALGQLRGDYNSAENRNAGFTKQRIGFEEGNVKIAGTDFRAAVKPYNEERDKLARASGLLDAPIDPATGKRKISESAWNAAIANLTKWSQGGGTMTDTDVALTKGGENLFNSIEGAKNYFKGTTSTTATRDQQEALIDLVKKGTELNQQARINAARESLASAIEQGEEDLFDKNGKLKPVVSGPLLRMGLEFISYSPETGAVIVPVDSKKKSTIKIPTGGNQTVEASGNEEMSEIEKLVKASSSPNAQKAFDSLKRSNASPEEYAKFLIDLRKHK